MERTLSGQILLLMGLFLFQVCVGLLAVSPPLTAMMLGLMAVLGFVLVSIRDPRWSYSLVILLLPLSSMSLFAVGKIDFRPPDPPAMLTFFVWMLGGMGRKEWRVEESFVDVPLLLLFAWTSLSIVWSIAPFSSLLLVTKILYGVLVFYLAVNLIRDEESLGFILKAWYLMALFLAGLGVYEFISEGIPQARSYGLGRISHWGHPVRTVGFEEGPDRLGFTMNLAIMVFLPFMLTQRSVWRFRLLFVALLGMFLVTATTLSRASWLSLTTGLGFFVIASGRFRKVFLVAASLGLGALLLLINTPYAWVFLQRLSTLLLPVQEAIPNRVSNWQMGWQIFNASPLIGLGSGTFQVLKGNAPHNLIVELVSGTGIIGYSLFLYLIGRALWQCIQTLRAGGLEEWERLSVVGFIAGISAYLVQSNFTSFRLKEYEMWAFLGLAVASVRLFGRKQKTYKGG